MESYFDENLIRYWYKADSLVKYTDKPTWIDNIYCFRGRIIHRVGGPAIKSMAPLRACDSKSPNVMDATQWLVDGKYHRDNGPAIEWMDGSEAWFKNGLAHRLGGPSLDYIDGTREWRVEGKLHRLDGPALEWSDIKEWRQNDLLHREDGPARECSNGKKEYYRFDKLYKIEDQGCTSYYLNDELHREYGPAYETKYGDRKYLQYGKLHREEGPAIEYGPLGKRMGGIDQYWLHGRQIFESDKEFEQFEIYQMLE